MLSILSEEIVFFRMFLNLFLRFTCLFIPYATPSNLFFGKEVLLSKEGVQQGDPLGPLLFSLAINDAISCCKSEFNMWYLDDGTLGGNVDVVLADFDKIMEL